MWIQTKPLGEKRFPRMQRVAKRCVLKEEGEEGNEKRHLTYSFLAGMFARHMEVDHIFTHDDVRNAVTVVGNLTRPQRNVRGARFGCLRFPVQPTSD